MMNRGSMTQSHRRPAARQPLSTGNSIAILLAMLMVYSVVLLRLGLSAAATAGLATTLATVSGGVARRAAQHARSRPPRVTRAAREAGTTDSQAEESTADSSVRG